MTSSPRRLPPGSREMLGTLAAIRDGYLMFLDPTKPLGARMMEYMLGGLICGIGATGFLAMRVLSSSKETKSLGMLPLERRPTGLWSTTGEYRHQ